MRERSILAVVSDLVQARPEAPMLHFRDLANPETPDRKYTYGQLWREAAAYAQVLEDLPPGSQTLIVSPLEPGLLAAHLGALMAGCMASIFTHPSEKLQDQVYRRNLENALRIMRPQAVVVSPLFADTVEEAASRGGLKVIPSDQVDATGNHQPLHWQDVQPQDTAVIQYSSGSTGLQKGVALSHEMVLGQCASYADFIGLDSKRDLVCSWLPLYHDMGLFTSWLMPLITGTPVSFIDPFQWVKNPLSLLSMIQETRGTLCWLPNFAFSLLASRVSDQDAESLNLSSMRGFTNCSEPVSAAAMQAFYGSLAPAGLQREALWTCYAMAENSFAVTAAGGPSEPPRTLRLSLEHYSQGRAVPRPEDGHLEMVSCGVPIPGCQLKIVDGEHLPLDDGLVGEIAIQSPYLLSEYLNNPQATAQALDQEGWYYTGDLGFLLDGRLYVTGRQKDLIIVGGRNFYPQDIEHIVNNCPGAISGRCVALGLEDEALGTQRVLVIVESHLKEPAEKGKLAAAVRRQVFEELDCPVAEVWVKEHMWLLKTSSGKIARKPNLERYLEDLEDQKAAAEKSRPDTAILPREKAGLLETAAWSLAASLIIYFYFLFFVFGENQSWNVYAGF